MTVVSQWGESIVNFDVVIGDIYIWWWLVMHMLSNIIMTYNFGE